MSYQTYLIIILVILTLLLTVLLITRTRRDKKRLAVITKMRRNVFSEFLMTNAIDGSIVEVARRLSDILIKSFDCKYIIFLRKKRGILELNYYHGTKNFKKTDFTIPYNRKLDLIFREDYLPRPINLIEKLLPDSFMRKKKQYGMDLFFPIFWRENLYGVYFVKSNMETKTNAFNLLLAGLAQSLSAAYHIKWHEAKKETIDKFPKVDTTIKSQTMEGQNYATKILKLIKHKKSNTVVLKLIETIKDIAGLKGVAYVYQSSSENENPTVIKNGISGNITQPDRVFLDKIINSLKDKTFYDINKLDLKDTLLDGWLNHLKKNGVGYLASFPLTNRRQGLLVWSEHKDISLVSRQLEQLKRNTIDIVENAEDYEMVEEMSFTDNLTKLANQRYFIKRLKEELSRAKRYNRKLALIIVDIDELKAVNDNYGHLAGDALIRKMGEVLKSSVRVIDLVARYGGDEFCIIMPETDKETCLKFMERLQTKIRTTQIISEHLDKPFLSTISMGAAIYPDHGLDEEKMIFTADMALLNAKESGRNQYSLSSVEYMA